MSISISISQNFVNIVSISYGNFKKWYRRITSSHRLFDARHLASCPSRQPAGGAGSSMSDISGTVPSSTDMIRSMFDDAGQRQNCVESNRRISEAMSPDETVRLPPPFGVVASYTVASKLHGVSKNFPVVFHQPICSHRCPIAVYSPSRVQRRLCRPQNPSEIRWEGVLRPCSSSVESAANRTQVDAFHASFQALFENILLQDCLL